MLTFHAVAVLTFHIFKPQPHTIKVFRSVAETHTLIMLKTRQNAYDTAFLLYIFVAYKPVWITFEKSRF